MRKKEVSKIIENNNIVSKDLEKALQALKQAKAPPLRNERASVCHDLAFAEVISYNKANLERVEQNEGRQQAVSRTKRRKKFNGNVIGKWARLWYYGSETIGS